MTAGYKGRITADNGAYYAPYIPVWYSWKRYLADLHEQYLQWKKVSDGDPDGLVDATTLMQKRYPGNYVVVEVYDPHSGKFVFKLEFADPAEETVWILKWT